MVYANAQPPYGMMAEKTLINPAAAIEVPEGIDPILAAAVPNPALSVWLSFEHRTRIRPGQHVLVLGATGVTGALAVQLAKAAFGPAGSLRLAATKLASNGCRKWAPTP